MTDLSTANHSDRCNFESAIRLAAEFFAHQHQVQHQQQQQQQPRLDSPIFPYLRCRQQQQQQPQQQQQQQPQSAGHLQSTFLSQQASLQQPNTSLKLEFGLHQQQQQQQQANSRLTSNENGLNTLSPSSQLALLQASNEHPTAAAAFHAHLLLQSQVSLVWRLFI